MKERANIHITGIVQGVGFRPYVYRIASILSLVGYVLNLGDAGVRIIVEGNRQHIEELIQIIKKNPPSISQINSIDVKWTTAENKFDTFHIKKSSMVRNAKSTPIIPPDIAICDDCIDDMNNSQSRWYLYPFTSCAVCGPRFSTITDLPYDRPYTTMIDFPLCNTCNTGYTNPLDRRYHAQTTACNECGPKYQLFNSEGQNVSGQNPIVKTVRLIDEGAIVAIQGIAGTHIVTKTSDLKSIQTLRKRKNRFQRPFAIMVKNLIVLHKIASITQSEMETIVSWRRPIVLLRKKKSNFESESVLHEIPNEVLDEIAPGLDTIGIMLPYAPLHHLLFKYSNEQALLMTSANPTGIPMYIDPKTIISELNEIVDYYLLHNRKIHQRADDSVIKFVQENNPVFIRRARGNVPEPIVFEGPWNKFSVIGVGAEEKSTGAIMKSGRIYLTQHIGDTNCVENIEFLSDAIVHMKHLLGVSNIDGIGCDLHPEFLSTEFAEKTAEQNRVPLIKVQHHHAHLSSLLVDNGLTNNVPITCITADGFGYGIGGDAWGGEVLVGDVQSFRRMGGLKSIEYLGGDLSAKYAIRSFIGILSDSVELPYILNFMKEANIAPGVSVSEESLSMLLEAKRKGINTIMGSSAGRFLDAVSIALGVCSENTYDGECPMKLEAIAKQTDLYIEPEFIIKNNEIVLDTSNSLRQLIQLKTQNVSVAKLAYAAQWHLGISLAEIACQVSKNQGIKHVGFSGGVALNRIITKAVVSRITEKNLIPLIHKQIPPGDGGISAGQVAIVAANIQE